MNRKFAVLAAPFALVFALHGAAFAEVAGATVERKGPDRVVVSWRSGTPVDVYMADWADAGLAVSRLVSDDDADGVFEIATTAAARPYFTLKDSSDGRVVRVAERALALEQGSNFRDLGGYPAAGGKHVRWGRIFRSGATAMLTDADVASIKALGLSNLIDLRSSEERVLAPTRLDGVRYAAVGYSMASLSTTSSAIPADSSGVYRQFPILLAPQMRVVFQTLLAREGPVAYNCSAGQDRTGFATALVLTALGVPRDVIFADYHLSTTYRRPQFEMPRIDPAAHHGNAAATLFAGYQKDPRFLTPQPLFDAQQRPLLETALKEIEGRWGSVEAYLDKELGVRPAEIAKLRAEYLQ
jgi:protein-tyrosine phosphatase